MFIMAWLNHCFNNFFPLGNLPPTFRWVIPPESHATWYFPVPLTHRVCNHSNPLAPSKDRHPEPLVLHHLTTQSLVSVYSLWLLTSGFNLTHYPLWSALPCGFRNTQFSSSSWIQLVFHVKDLHCPYRTVFISELHSYWNNFCFYVSVYKHISLISS